MILASIEIGKLKITRNVGVVLLGFAMVYAAGISALVCLCPGLREMPAFAKCALIGGLVFGPLAYFAWRLRGFLAVLFLLLQIVTVIKLFFGIWEKVAVLRKVDEALRRGRAVMIFALCQVGMIILALCIGGNRLAAWGILCLLLLLNFYLMTTYARWLSNPLQTVVRLYREYDRQAREKAETAAKEQGADSRRNRDWMIKQHEFIRGPVLDAICTRSFLGTTFVSSFMLLVVVAVFTFAGVFRCISLLQPASFTNLTATDVWGYPYFSAVTILTIGYGDIAPHLALARLAVVLEGLTGVALLILAVLTFSVVSVQKWDEYTAQVRSEAGSLSLALSFDPRSVRGTRLNMAELPAKPKSKDSKPGSGSGKTKEG